MFEIDPNLSIRQSGPFIALKKPFRWRLWLALGSPLLFIGGFVIFFFHLKSEYLPRVTAASDRLHEEREHGEDGQIYFNADEAFRAALPQDTALRYLGRVRRKLGPCQYSGPTTWRVDSNTNRTLVMVGYHDQCLNGEADETLTWRVADQSALLVGMNVNSPVLLTD